MGEHIDSRKGPKRKKLKEGIDPLARANRVTFKNYLREIEEELLEADLENEPLEEEALSQSKRTEMARDIADAMQAGYEEEGEEGDFEDAYRHLRDDATDSELNDQYKKWVKK